MFDPKEPLSKLKNIIFTCNFTLETPSCENINFIKICNHNIGHGYLQNNFARITKKIILHLKKLICYLYKTMLLLAGKHNTE